MDRAGWTRIDLNNPEPQPAPRKWTSHVCGGRTFTWKKGILQAGQLAAMGTFSAIGFALALDPEKADKTISESLLGACVLVLTASILRESSYLVRGCKEKKEGCLNPFVLIFTAALVGAIATQIIYSQARNRVNDYENNLERKEGAFNQSMLACMNDMINQAPLFTASPCVPCYYIEEGFTGPQNGTVMQELLVNFNEVVCVNPANALYFQNLTDVNANQTEGHYPCLQELQSINQSWSAPAVAYMNVLNIMPPLAFNASVINDTCKSIVGFGTLGFELTQLCGIFFNVPDSMGDFDFDMLQCITPALEDYMQAYAEKIRSDQISSSEPSDAFYVLDIAPVKMMWALASLSLVAVLGYEGGQRYFKSRQERRALTE